MTLTYCRGCGDRLGQREAQNPDTLVTDSGAWCARCSTLEIDTLPPEQQQIILGVTLQRELARPRPTRRVMRGVRASRRMRRPRARASSGALAAILVLGALVLVGILIALSSR